MTPLQSHSRLLTATALFIAVGSMATLSGCGGGGSTTQTGRQGVPKGQTAVRGGANFAGIEATPAKASPPLKLHDSLGKQVELAQYRGNAVLLTFIYTHCPDICPLIVSHLKTAQAELGPKARDLQIVAVSTDPRGRHAEDRRRLFEATRDDRQDAVPDWLAVRTGPGLDRLEPRWWPP